MRVSRAPGTAKGESIDMETLPIGKPIERIDARAKVTGRAEYGADIRLPGLLYCKGVYAAHPHAKLLKVYTEEAAKMSGVVCVVTGADIPGEKMFGELYVDQYALVCDKTRFYGDVIAVVAAETQEQADAAAELVHADYEELPILATPKMALESDIAINADYPDNICGNVHVRKGNAAAGLQEADVIVSGTYKTGFVEHAYIEPESVTVIPDRIRRELTVLGSAQAPYNLRLSVARTLNIPVAQVIVKPSVIGGSFGGKIESAESLAVRAGLIALKTGRPAQYTLTREESIRESYKRHPIDFDIQLGAKQDGTLVAMKVEAIGDAGAYINMSPPVMYKTATLGPGPYRIENVDYNATSVMTNNVHTGSMRGFGTPQAIFALENAMDELAAKLNLTPTELRRKNLLQNGDVSPCGHLLDFHEVSIRSVMEKAAQELGFDEKFAQYAQENKDGRRIRRGVGIAVSMRGASIGADGNGFDVARAFIEVLEDGSVNVDLGLTELGQGLRTCQSQMVAEGMGVSFERISFGNTDTSRAPATGACIASRSTLLGGGALKDASRKVHAIMARVLERKFNKPTDDIVFAEDRVRFADVDISFTEAAKICYALCETPIAVGTYVVPKLNWNEHEGFGEPFYTYTYSCHAAEVSVDLDTGSVDVIRMVGCHDMGRAINPVLVKGQIYGGLAMAQGMALTEDLGHNAKTSALKNLNFEDYLIPTVLDVPDENVPLLDEHPDPRSAFGGRSLGEPATEPGAGALICAINHALGHPGLIRELPADLDRVFAAVRAMEGGDA
ncbi:MAG: xanthine dehydrogenase [Firmicutes bacterium HGW-Firmicutes-9]|jgi:CO/xanthine dehydrogenase Mo-binding subunit|nr:MAG: xanthine dehydrogenase [Firmicutes bacterium HGW-Firmicutes-9]